jgi:hypothetical protein
MYEIYMTALNNMLHAFYPEIWGGGEGKIIHPRYNRK